ncbi:MAG: PorT family protein [Prevotella sp.]|nr:PorT family protein [Prevotella sp.]
MKRYLLTVALTAVMAVASAQNEPGTLTIQPKGGFGLATLTNVSESEMTGVGMWGGELEYALKERLSLAAGINFDMLGYSINDTGDVKDWYTSLNYLAVPVVANYYIYKGLAIKAGLQPGLLLSANETYKQNGDKHDTKVTSHYNKFDLSIPIGLSFEFSHVVINARYLLGLTKVNKDGDKTSRNSVIMITTGYKFKL